MAPEIGHAVGFFHEHQRHDRHFFEALPRGLQHDQVKLRKGLSVGQYEDHSLMTYPGIRAIEGPHLPRDDAPSPSLARVLNYRTASGPSNTSQGRVAVRPLVTGNLDTELTTSVLSHFYRRRGRLHVSMSDGLAHLGTDAARTHNLVRRVAADEAIAAVTAFDVNADGHIVPKSRCFFAEDSDDRRGQIGEHEFAPTYSTAERDPGVWQEAPPPRGPGWASEPRLDAIAFPYSGHTLTDDVMLFVTDGGELHIGHGFDPGRWDWLTLPDALASDGLAPSAVNRDGCFFTRIDGALGEARIRWRQRRPMTTLESVRLADHGHPDGVRLLGAPRVVVRRLPEGGTETLVFVVGEARGAAGATQLYCGRRPAGATSTLTWEAVPAAPGEMPAIAQVGAAATKGSFEVVVVALSQDGRSLLHYRLYVRGGFSAPRGGPAGGRPSSPEVPGVEPWSEPLNTGPASINDHRLSAWSGSNR